jgi:hypothetical protein
MWDTMTSKTLVQTRGKRKQCSLQSLILLYCDATTATAAAATAAAATAATAVATAAAARILCAAEQ